MKRATALITVGTELIVPRRQTSYGMDEILVLAPCGTLVGFAAPLPKA